MLDKHTIPSKSSQGQNGFNGEKTQENGHSDVWDGQGDLGDYLDKREAEEKKIEREKHNRSLCASEHIDALFAAGARIFPVRKDKTPAVPKGRSWKNYSFSRENLIKHRGPLGLLPGSLGLSVIDIDSPEYDDSLKERIEGIGEKFCEQKTLKGGTHVAFKTSQPVRNAKWQREGVRGDFRGREGYVVMWEPWKWADAVAGLDALPDCNDGFQAFFDEFLYSAVDADGKFKWNEDSIKEVLELLDPEVGRDDWLRYCRAIADAAVEAGLNEQAVFALVKGWSEKADNWGGDADLDAVLRPCNGYEGPHAAAGPLLAYAKDHGWEIPRGHGGPRDRAGKRKINGHVDDPFTLLAETCVNSGNFCRMQGQFAHWLDDQKRWELVPDKDVASAIAVGEYLGVAGLNPQVSLTQSVGKHVFAHLKRKFEPDDQRTSPHGLWPEKDGQVFDQFTGKRRDIVKEDYLTKKLSYNVDESAKERPELVYLILSSAFKRDEEMIDFFDDRFASMLFEKNKKQKIDHWYGKDGSGKGVLSNMAVALSGAHNAYIGDADALLQGRSEQLCPAEGKQVLIFNEKVPPQNTTKQIVSGNPINVRAMRGDPYTFCYEGHLLFVSQASLPYTLDAGMLRRIIPIHFKNSPAEADIDEELDDKLEAILPQIWGYYYNRWNDRVRHLKELEYPLDVRHNINSYKQAEGTVEGWIVDRLSKDDSREIAQKDIIDTYVTENEEDSNPKNKTRLRNAITRKLAGLGYSKTGDRGYYATWIEKSDSDPDDEPEGFDDEALEDKAAMEDLFSG